MSDTSNENVNVNAFPDVDTVGDDKRIMLVDPVDNAGSIVSFYKMKKQIAADATDLVARAQIENLTKLPEGSTTGDAELSDIRVGADGTKYPTAGDAVRTQIERAEQKTDESFMELNESIKRNTMTLLEKVDGGYVGDDGCLYLTADDAVVVGPLGPFAGGGGGTGGGGSGNNAVLTLTNTSGWLATTVAKNGSCVLKANWSSLEDELSTGAGTLTVRVNGSAKTTKSVAQGDISVDVKDYLSDGTNVVKLTVTDVYGNNRTINFSVTVMAVSLSSTFDVSSAFTDAITFTYIPVGNVEKTVHFVLDGTELDTVTTSVSGRQLSCVISKQSHGVHSLKVYFTCVINDTTISSNELYYEIICIESGDKTPIIASDYIGAEIQQYASIPIEYRVYNPLNMTAEVKLYANGELLSTQTVDRTVQTWTYRADTIGALELKIESDNGIATASKVWNLMVTESDVTIGAETEDLVLYLSSYGRSNNEENPGTWTYGDTSAAFTNFNFKSDGWQLDKDKISVLRVSGDARLEIPMKIFEKDFRGTGKTIEFEFSTSEIMDYDATILSCMSGDRGIKLTAQKATLKSEQSEIFTQYKEDEHVRISFVVEKRSENRLVYIYINGIMSGAIQYPVDDDFSQQTPVNITIGSNDCVCNLYCIRVYDNDLTRHQILENWIADTQNVDDMLARYRRNDVYNAYGDIVIDKIPKGTPYIVITSGELPTYKGDKKKISGYYVDPQHPELSFTFENAEIDVQGTSSAGYERKNFKIKFKGGFVINGVPSETYSMRGEGKSIPTATYTFKADVASSEGANNVELVILYNDICPYKTPPQLENPLVRQGIDGFPIVMFQDDGKDVTFIGKYNFNNDKGTEEVYGFTEGDESWETLNNTSARANWKSADFTGEEWLNDFEGRYPDGNTDPAKLSELATWVVSTDRSAATNETLSSPVIYDGVTYDKDTAEYRLAKFKNEAANHFEMDSLLFYYLFTEIFLMGDSRTKNTFPTIFNGHKWIWLPYDFDTAIGINNEGALVFDYYLEDTDKVDSANVYNGQDSVIWTNVRDAFHDELAKMYQTLRSSGGLSYEEVERRFEEHQSKWGEAIFNEDAWFKYLAPLVEKGIAAYLSMLLGSKEEQRKWWLYNRFRYMDSKYNAGDALADFIMIRAYAKQNIAVTPYAAIYASVKYGSYLVQKRALRGASYVLDCPLDTFNDTECYIYSSSQLKSVGDLSGLMVGYADFSKATRLQELKLGDSSETYSNTNMKELYLGNNVLLKTLDLRNCPNLAQTIDVSGCSNLEEVYFDGTSIPGINLPAGGILKKIHLPGTITNLTIINQSKITELEIPSYENLTTLRLENVGDVLDSKTIVETLKENSRIRIIGFNWSFESIDDALAMFTLLDTMRGLDENGGNMDKPQLSGTVHVPNLTGAQLADIQNRYPSVNVTYDHITSYCYCYNYDGTKILQTISCTDGADAKYTSSTPSKPSTAQYTYTFAGWSLTLGGSVNANALKNVTADRNVYPVFTASIRKYTVYFYNGSTLLQTVTNVPYGGSATYTGTTPVSPDGSADDFPFESWEPKPTNITGNTSCKAQFGSPLEVKEITDSWEEIIAACEDGSYATKYKIGNYKPLDLGSEGVVNMQIAGKDVDDLADGSGKAKISWISKELLKTRHRYNTSEISVMDYVTTGHAFTIFATSNSKLCADMAKGLKPSDEATVKIEFISSMDCVIIQESTRLQTVGSGSTTLIEDEEYEINVNGTQFYSIIAGQVNVSKEKVSINSGEKVTITFRFKEDSAATTNKHHACYCTLRFEDDTNNTLSFNEVVTGSASIPYTTGTTFTFSQNALATAVSYEKGTGNIGGWEESELRKYLKNTIKPLIPESVLKAIVKVNKENNGLDELRKVTMFTSSEDVWIPDSDYSSADGIYKILTNKGSSYQLSKRINGEQSTTMYWLRGIYRNSSSSNVSMSVTTNGGITTNSVTNNFGIALGFCF